MNSYHLVVPGDLHQPGGGIESKLSGGILHRNKVTVAVEGHQAISVGPHRPTAGIGIPRPLYVQSGMMRSSWGHHGFWGINWCPIR